MQPKKRVGLSSEEGISDVLEAVLAKGNATDAIVAGVACAAALDPSVFLGSLTVLVVGAGVGARVIDGRVTQPGKGAARPRGFLEGDAIPDSARVGVPGLPAALATALSASGSLTLAQAMAPALDIAKTKSPERRAVLEAFSRRGPLAMTDGDIARELIAAAGPLAGGILTKDDLSTARPTQVASLTHSNAGTTIFTPAWEASDGTKTRTLLALDWHGTFALAAYESHIDGVDVNGLGLRAPLVASPVLRGETRTKPGSPVEMCAPLAVRERDGFYDAAVAFAHATVAPAEVTAVLQAGSDQPASPASGWALYAFRSRDGVRGLRLRA